MLLNRREILIGISAALAAVPASGAVAASTVVKNTHPKGRRIDGNPATLSGMAPEERDPFDVAVGERLRKARRGRKRTQDDLRRWLDVSQASISAYESGTTRLRPEQIAEVCRFLRISSDQLLGLAPLPKNWDQDS